METLLSITARIDGFLYRCRNDRNYSMIHLTEGVERIIGYPASDFIENAARSFSQVIHPGDLAMVYREVDRALESQTSWDLDYRMQRSDGTSLWVHEIGAGVFSQTGALLYLEGFVIDIAGRKRAEAALFETQQQLLESNAALQQSLADREAALAMMETANRAKSGFLSIMTHELRTPLNAIIGFSDLIGRETFGRLENERYREYVVEINQAGTNLLTIINNILDLTRLTSGQHSMDLEPLTLPQVFQPATKDLKAAAAAKGIALHVASEAAPCRFLGDRGSVVRVLTNLIDNAVKFTPSGGTVVCGLEHRPDEGKVVILVKDSGPGIPDDRISDLARPFSQLSSAYTRSTGGIGLGLAIAKALTEAMGGSIEFSSRVAGGTTVGVLLPETA
ncbi:MAG TPA: HAMP domain-containing sensor histidine kinase [Candidatus Cybelea sp.]|nr:HAMP domain-containing sensor histidine kinase [Candidatus Cybelea sp.]